MTYTPITRDMSLDDVLSWKINGKEIVIVSKDGKKYRVPA